MFKCKVCRHIFEEGEQAKWEERRGEYFGENAFETMYGCPICKGEYEEVTKCKICGEWSKDEYCESCVSKTTKLFSALMRQNFSAEQREMIEEFINDDKLRI